MHPKGPYPLAGVLQCRAKSKQSGKQCRKPASPGKHLCYFHGAKSEGKANLAGSTYGHTSQYVSLQQLPAILERVAELKTPAGKEEALLVGAAVTEQRLAQVPDDPEYIEKFVAARKSVREDIKTAHELTQEEKPQGPTTFVVAAYDATQQAPFQSRTIDGPCTIRYLDGEPFMLEGRCWVPCAKLVDDESGAEYFTRVIEG